MKFTKSKDVYIAVKLYSIGSDQESIDRGNLVDALLSIFEHEFNEYPLEYDINGPYRIPKGRSVQLKTFKSKLSELGHDKYVGYHGFTEKRLGFDVLFDAHIGNIATYTEVVIWYNTELWNLKFKEIVKRVMLPLPVSSGCQIEIDEDYHIGSESKIKNGLSGGTTITVSNKHLLWIEKFQEGAFRHDYKIGLLNRRQLDNALAKNAKIQSEFIGSLYIVTNNA